MISPCKHLNHDPAAFPHLELVTNDDGIKYWYRKNEEFNRRVQFCRCKRYRIGEYLDCYEPGYCNMYEMVSK